MISANGWLVDAVHCPSPNFNQRPNGMPIDLLVIHNISLPPGEFGGGWIQRFFQNQLDPQAHSYFASIASLQVSSHLLIDRLGNITQFVSFLDRAWHAGASQFEGRDNCNDFSIGIELEGTDHTPYTEAQYTALVHVTRLLLATYPAMSVDRIAGHVDVAPSRKTDPGPAFNWTVYRQMLTSI